MLKNYPQYKGEKLIKDCEQCRWAHESFEHGKEEQTAQKCCSKCRLAHQFLPVECNCPCHKPQEESKEVFVWSKKDEGFKKAIMEPKPPEESWRERNPRIYGLKTQQLAEFYEWNKEGKAAVFATPWGNIYTDKAHKRALYTQKQQTIKKALGIIKGMRKKPDYKYTMKRFERGWNYCLDEISKSIQS